MTIGGESLKAISGASGMRHRGLGVGVFAALLLACLVPASAFAHHPVKTVEGHIEEDSVAVTPAMEERLGEQTEAATEADAERAAAAVAGDEAEVGRWGPVIDWPVVGIHMALLPERQGPRLRLERRQARASPTTSFTRATVWDPGERPQADAMLTRLQHLLQRPRTPHGRDPLHGGRQQNAP